MPLGRGRPQFSLSRRLEVSPGPITNDPSRNSMSDGAIFIGSFGKHELAQQCVQSGQKQNEGHPVGHPAYQVPLVAKFGRLRIEEPLGDP